MRQGGIKQAGRGKGTGRERLRGTFLTALLDSFKSTLINPSVSFASSANPFAASCFFA